MNCLWRVPIRNHIFLLHVCIGHALVHLSWKTCQILGRFLQDNALFLQSAKILQKVQETQDLGKFLQETSDLFIILARSVC